MSVKRYGIYLCYPPNVDLRKEGLGRYLAEFLSASLEHRDLKWVIVCPSWMAESLEHLFEDARIDRASFEILAPPKVPLLLTLHRLWQTAMRRRRQVRHRRPLLAGLGAAVERCLARIDAVFASTRSLLVFLAVALVVVSVLMLRVLACILSGAFTVIGTVVRRMLVATLRSVGVSHAPRFRRPFRELAAASARPQDLGLVVRLYKGMVQRESVLMEGLIGKQADIAAWYCPTTFWPSFNRIDAPKLMCVPDVVFTEFPVGYARLGGERNKEVFADVERAVTGADHFVTFSEHVKWRTLVDRFHRDPSRVHTIRHGANRLDHLITVRDMPDNDAATHQFCRQLLRGALSRTTVSKHAPVYAGADIRFMFYASQIRPHKNVLTLLRAYEWLLRRRHIQHKLLLTGNLQVAPEAADFVAVHRLESDVICVPGLSAQELAACYRLADLAVNPSLFEGGLPFTFSEALSVGTPVVMARMPVTTEVINDPELARQTLFDPYDWRAMADHIEHALQNRSALYKLQRAFFDDVIAARTWRDVVREHVDILDRISLKPAEARCP